VRRLRCEGFRCRVLTDAAKAEYELELDLGYCVCRQSCLAADRRRAVRGPVAPVGGGSEQVKVESEADLDGGRPPLLWRA
jgi:hypothetical protein